MTPESLQRWQESLPGVTRRKATRADGAAAIGVPLSTYKRWIRYGVPDGESYRVRLACVAALHRLAPWPY